MQFHKKLLGSLAVNKKNKNGRSEIAPFDFSGSLAKTVLNSLSANIAIIDEYGVILETNQAWRNYATVNKMEGHNDSIGVNYLALCDATTGKETKYARDVAAGIRSVINGDLKEFLYDYPCHGPDGRHGQPPGAKHRRYAGRNFGHQLGGD